MGSKKDRDGMDLREAEDIKKRWQEYTKDLHDPANHNGVICREPAREIPPMTRSCGEA